MDIMMRLKGAGFSVIANEFRQREKRLGTGLPLQDFVEIVLQGLPKPKTAEEKYANISALVDLFEDMDINGDGTMEFDEFTSYCVDAGMVATRTKTIKLNHRYVRNPRHVIKTMNGSLGVEKVRWSPLFKRFLVLENAAKCVKLFNADGYMVGEVRSQSTLLNTPPPESEASPRANTSAAPRLVESDGSLTKRTRGRDRDASTPTGNATPSLALPATVNSGIFILDAAFLHKFQCLAMSTTDFVISFYNMEEPRHQQRLASTSDTAAATARSNPSYEVLPKLTITTTTAQLLLRFCEEGELLLSAGNDFIVNVWKITDLENKTLYKRLIHHQDMIMDVLEIPVHDMIASCDLNHTVQLWDIHDCRFRGTLVGHARGIKQMVFSKDHDMLLTAGFEFDAYGWDIASRQVVMKLVGHRAPLVGVQLALFQTERAVTVDSSGVIKVWDISRASGGTLQSGSTRSSTRQGGRSASHAVVLESLDPSHELSRFEPTTFISLHPHRRDLWTAASGSSTLHLFRSTRVQQFDEIPLKAFYHYNANRFVVVSGPTCSIWDGEHGICLDEFANVGAYIGGTSRTGSTDLTLGHAPPSHNGSLPTTGMNASTDILLCVQDAKCKKLVILSEEGEMGVFNSQNFMQMRRCEEKFRSSSPPLMVGDGACAPPASCGIVGLHYCSENKLIIATDSHNSSILVIDDSNNDSSKGIRETQVLRRLVHVPGGIAASAYSYHATLIATLDQERSNRITLWDFETLVSVGICELEAEDVDAGVCLNVLSSWDEFPVLLAADSQGGVYFFAVMPTVQARTGKLLHAFVNDHAYSAEKAKASELADADGELRDSEKDPNGGTFITQGAEAAARKFLLKRKSLHKAISNRKGTGVDASSNGSPECCRQVARGGVVTCMQVVLDDSDDQSRYLLFTADDRGVVRVWNLSDMMRRLSIFKIPETNCKYLRRGYHPRAMFAHDCNKHVNVKESEGAQESSGEASIDLRARIKQAQLKKLAKQRTDSKKKSNLGPTSQLAKLLPGNRVVPGQAPPSATTVAAAEAFLTVNSSSSLRRLTSQRASHPTELDYQTRLLESGAMINARSRPADNRRRSQCWLNLDVNIVSVWSAHSDGITSMEVSKHPNIVVTCSVDMRVFIWNWHGACLGKLFDAENIGPYRWKFCKDDSRRESERRLLLEELIQELELSPLQKAHYRRQTLYQSHVQRKTQRELPHVSVMLLDHIVSQHPEVAAMEKDGLSSASTDEKINAEMEKTRQRNYRAKASMLETLARASTAPPTASTVKEIARIHSLAQVGPLLCVDKFEMKQELTQMKFAEKEELKMDRKYLSEELAIGVDLSPEHSRRKKSDVASIKSEIERAQRHAEDMMQNKIALQRHALSIYSNLRLVQRNTQHQKHEAMLLTKQTGLAELSDFGSGPTLDEKRLEELLEPSPFLRSKLPERVLSIRPQTAPSKPNLSKTNQGGFKVQEDQRSKMKSHSENQGSKEQLLVLMTSASESSLLRPNSSLGIRKCSLDQMYLDELQRQHNSVRHGHSAVADAANDSPALDTNSVHTTSLRKLESINAIIDKAQRMCDSATMKSIADDELSIRAPPNSNEHTPPLALLDQNSGIGSRSTTLATLHETEDAIPTTNYSNCALPFSDEDILRNHLDATRRRIDDAMGDCERVGRTASKRSLINKQRDQVEHQKKGKRMEDYLQQKRREMNTNIGAVFKRTAFAFPSGNATNDTAIERHGGKQRKKALRRSATNESIDPRAIQEAQVQVEKSKVFGIYGVREVMSIIRLFWSMDDDGSGSLTLSELLAYKSYFEKLGYHDMTTVFQAIDKDGSGNITLKELLEICFQYATKYQIEEMLKLAKLGDVATYFDASRGRRTNAKVGVLPSSATAECYGQI